LRNDPKADAAGRQQSVAGDSPSRRRAGQPGLGRAVRLFALASHNLRASGPELADFGKMILQK